VKIAVLNESSLCADADVAVIADAVNKQMEVVAQAYDIEVPEVVSVTRDQAAAAAEATDIFLVVFDDSDQAGALGYHAEDPNGQPYARVFARDSIAGLTGADPASLSGVQSSSLVLSTVSSVVSHEAIETVVDAPANEWADDGNGNEWAREACDPVESDSYSIDVDGQTVVVSNFVTAAFFDPGAAQGAVLDYLGNVQAPFTLDSGGYAIVRTDGQEQAIWGESLPAWRKAQHAASEADARSHADTARLASRTGKRFAKAKAEPLGAELLDHPGTGQLMEGVDAPADGTMTEISNEPVAVDGGHPEPTVVGAMVLQDNVSVPGTERTANLAQDGTVHHSEHKTDSAMPDAGFEATTSEEAATRVVE